MRITTLMVSSLLAFAACADEQPTASSEHAFKENNTTPVHVTKKQLGTPTDAESACGTTSHVPSVNEIQGVWFHQCVSTTSGLACTPIIDQALADSVQVPFWTSTQCGPHASFVANFDSGELTCTDHAALAQTLCID
jgi:hypothetical protein